MICENEQFCPDAYFSFSQISIDIPNFSIATSKTSLTNHKTLCLDYDYSDTPPPGLEPEILPSKGKRTVLNKGNELAQ